jgi:uncharacterized protein YegP (UPF0339 family)
MPKTYIEIYKRRDGKWGFREKSGNHQVIGGSGGQGYSRRRDAVRGARRAAPGATVKGAS